MSIQQQPGGKGVPHVGVMQIRSPTQDSQWFSLSTLLVMKCAQSCTRKSKSQRTSAGRSWERDLRASLHSFCSSREARLISIHQVVQLRVELTTSKIPQSGKATMFTDKNISVLCKSNAASAIIFNRNYFCSHIIIYLEHFLSVIKMPLSITWKNLL